HAPVHGAVEQLLLVLEVVVEPRFGEVQSPGQLVHRDALVALLHQDRRGPLDDVLAPLAVGGGRAALRARGAGRMRPRLLRRPHRAESSTRPRRPSGPPAKALDSPVNTKLVWPTRSLFPVSGSRRWR